MTDENHYFNWKYLPDSWCTHPSPSWTKKQIKKRYLQTFISTLMNSRRFQSIIGKEKKTSKSKICIGHGSMPGHWTQMANNYVFPFIQIQYSCESETIWMYQIFFVCKFTPSPIFWPTQPADFWNDLERLCSFYLYTFVVYRLIRAQESEHVSFVCFFVRSTSSVEQIIKISWCALRSALVYGCDKKNILWIALNFNASTFRISTLSVANYHRSMF